MSKRDQLTPAELDWLRKTLAYVSEGWKDRGSIKRRDGILRKLDAHIKAAGK
jgi:hypothetical protein